MKTLITHFKSFLKDKAGTTFLEYGLGFGLLVGATAASMQTMNENIEQSFFCNTPDQRNVNKEECSNFRSTYQQDRYDNQNSITEERNLQATSGANTADAPATYLANAKKKNYNTGLSVKAGEVYRITPKSPSAKVRLARRYAHHDPFNSLNGALDNLSFNHKGVPKSANGRKVPAVFATVTASSLDGSTVTKNTHPHLDFTFAENGELLITAAQDGLLQVGIMNNKPRASNVSNSVVNTYGYNIQLVTE